MSKRFTLDFLNKICNDKCIILLQNYSENELNSKKNIEFKCIDCNKNTSKVFGYIVKYDAICHDCSNSKKGIKARNTTLIKYGVKNISQLQEIKNKKKETTIKNYGVEHNSQCQDIKNKKVQTSLINNGVEYPQQSKEIREKSKQTCLNNYGVEYPSQSNEIKQKCINTSIEKYGTEYASQTKLFKDKVKKTCFEKYGINYPMQSENIKNKSKQTCLNNYGVEHPLQSEEIKQKIKETTKQKYGFEYYSKTKEFKEKIKETSLKKYGVEHPTQNEKIMEKISKNCYKLKKFIFPSGKEIICQGYEPFALQNLLKNYNICEDDIITGCKNVPTIWYNDDLGKKHRHYVDIFIPSQNTCIEVKSTWTAKKKYDKIFFKQIAAKEMGYLYEIWVYDNKGNIIETYT